VCSSNIKIFRNEINYEQNMDIKFRKSIIQFSVSRIARSVQCLTTDWTAGVRSPRQRFFLLTSASRPALGPTQPPMQWVPGALSPGVKRGRDVILTTHPILVPWLRKSRSYTSCHPNAPLWSVTEPLYLFTFYYTVQFRIFRSVQ
jgi:hypothetical protein